MAMPFTEKEVDNIDAAAGSKVCHRAHPVSLATERAELEAAIAWWSVGLSEGASKTRTVLAAARKHLETLPKPVWRVTGWLQEGAGRRAANFETCSRKEALDFARGYLEQGMRWVTVTQVQS